MPRILLTITCCLLFLIAWVRADCRLTDISTVIGGDYTVNSIKSEVFSHKGRRGLLLFGGFTKHAI